MRNDEKSQKELPLELFIDRNGNVVDANILGGLKGCFLTEDTVIPQILKQLKFSPGKIDGNKVACRIEFNLIVETY